jgi:hypothetical protein
VQELTEAVRGLDLPLGESSRRGLLQAAPAPPPAAQPAALDIPDGTMDPRSAFYVERPSDRVALQAIRGQGVTVSIKAPRQMGKSSLLIRTLRAAAATGKRTTFLDFQFIDRPALRDADTFFRQSSAWLGDKLGREDQVDAYWRGMLSNSHRRTRYVEQHLLRSLDAPVVLGMDEVETVFDSDFRSDFFGMLRAWHNNRTIDLL